MATPDWHRPNNPRNPLFLSRIPAKQRGMSSLMLLFVAGTGALALICALKLLPVYIENWSIKEMLSGIETEYMDSGEGLTPREMRSRVEKRLMVNQINAIDPRDLVIERTKSHFVLTANYESRVPLFANVDVVLKFENNKVELPLQK